VCINPFWETLGTGSPDPPAGYRWMLVADTMRGGALPEAEPLLAGRYDMGSRSVIIMVIEKIKPGD